MTLGGVLKNKHARLFLWVACLPMLFLILARGMVGVDTATYVQGVDMIRESGTLIFMFEPLFELLVLFLSRLIENSHTVVILIGLLTIMTLLLSANRLEFKRPVLFSLMVVPYFLLEMTMNGLRYGLAFSILVVAAIYITQRRQLVFVALASVAAMIQVTSIFLSAGLWLLLEGRLRTFIFVIVLSGLAFLGFDDYLMGKINAQSDLQSESFFAGAAPLMMNALSLWGFWKNRQMRQEAAPQIMLLLGFCIFSFFLAKFYYAGLRMQMLCLFLTYLFFATLSRQKSIVWGRKTVLFLLAAAILGTGFRLKNFYDYADLDESPFAPYHFSWEMH
jgi:EpsG family